MVLPRPYRLRATALLVAFLASVQIAPAQSVQAGRDTSPASVAQYALTDQMPIDPEVSFGTLPNGLRYYVRANGKPPRQAELRLVVKAGSVLEDDDQKGLAHFVEHMEFEGTEHFPQQSLVGFLSSLGLSIGPDANAATSFDDTQYTLRVPTDRPGVLDRALLALEDWARAASFEQSAVERERGIVLSEWRLNLGAQERTADAVRKAQLAGSRYADRSPIGDPNIIGNAQREQLTRFYRDWYRPDLMAVIVVGDINRDAVVAMIRERFGTLRSPSPVRPRPAFEVPEQPGTRYAVVPDKETTRTTVALTSLRPARNQGTVGGYRDILKDQLFAAMLGDRLEVLSRGANPPFLGARARRQLFEYPRTRDEVALEALVANDGAPRGLEALVTELERVKRFGFTAPELARAKAAMMRGSERVVTESPDRESESRADEYTRNFLEDEALPTIWQEHAFHQLFVPEVTLAEMNALANDWFPDQNRLVLVSAPEAAGVSLPTQAQLAAAVRTAGEKPLEAYVEASSEQPLMAARPRAGTIVKVTPRPEAGVTEWRLSNGALVVLKPTKLKEDQILFRAVAPGGTSLASDAQFIPARVADSVIPAGGVGQFDPVTLDRMLSSKAVGVQAFIDEINQGLGGGSDPQDLETMFQLIYLRFTAPRADPVVFSALQSQAKAVLANQLASPEAAFNQTLDAALNRDNPRRMPETQASVDRWNLASSLAFYKARFANAGDFTFVFVGSFTPEAIKPFVETYLASLPATQTHETWRDLGIRPPTGIIEKTVRKGIAPKAEVAIVFSGLFDYDDQHRLALRTMTQLLQGRLFDSIRQELGGTYSITATPGSEKYPVATYRVTIDWTCEPGRVATLVQRVFEEISYVKDTLLGPDRMTLVRESLQREFERNSQDNGYMLRQISRRYEDGESADLSSIDDLPNQFGTLTGRAIQEAANKYLDTANFVRVTLMPVQP